jgi:NAD(P)-dependent dehydrogenase (short-subunit alcohol dehydrogenase family)
MTNDTANHSVLITGSSTGIGAACVRRLADSGWRVYAGVRRDEDGHRLRGLADGDIVPVLIDVTDRADIERVIARIDDDIGSLGGLVNNAGIGVGGLVETLTDDEWQRQFDVNFFGLVAMTRAAMPLVSRADGRFVHIGSIAGRVAAAGLGPYAASKHAVEAFNWSLRGELDRSKMSSSVVEPGEIKTPIWDKADVQLRAFAEMLDQHDLRDRFGYMLDRQTGFVEEGRTKGVDADEVAKVVEHALTARRPKARYIVGTNAKAMAFVAKLPDRVRESFMEFGGRRYEKAGRSITSS